MFRTTPNLPATRWMLGLLLMPFLLTSTLFGQDEAAEAPAMAEEDAMPPDAFGPPMMPLGGSAAEALRENRQQMQERADDLSRLITEMTERGDSPQVLAGLKQELATMQSIIADMDRRLPRGAAEGETPASTLPPMGRSTLLRLRGQLEATLDDLDERLALIEDPDSPIAKILQDEHATATQQLDEVLLRLENRGRMPNEPLTRDSEPDTDILPEDLPDLTPLIGEDYNAREREAAEASGVSEAAARRLEQVNVAVEALRSAGFDDLADFVRMETERSLMDEGLPPMTEPGLPDFTEPVETYAPPSEPAGMMSPSDFPPLRDAEVDELSETVRLLREQMQQMQRQMESLQGSMPAPSEENEE